MSRSGSGEDERMSKSPSSGRSPRSDRSLPRASPKRSRSPALAGVSLYVSGLAARVDDEALIEHFKGEGKIKEARVVLDPRSRESRGFGFVDYEDPRDAEKAVKYLDRSVLKGRVIIVEKAKRGRPRTPTPGAYKGARSQRDMPPSRSERDRFDRRDDRRDRGERYDRYGDRDRYDGRERYDRYDRHDRYERYRRSRSPYRRRASPGPYRRRSPSPYRSRRSVSPY